MFAVSMLLFSNKSICLHVYLQMWGVHMFQWVCMGTWRSEADMVSSSDALHCSEARSFRELHLVYEAARPETSKDPLLLVWAHSLVLLSVAL